MTGSRSGGEHRHRSGVAFSRILNLADRLDSGGVAIKVNCNTFPISVIISS